MTRFLLNQVAASVMQLWNSAVELVLTMHEVFLTSCMLVVVVIGASRLDPFGFLITPNTTSWAARINTWADILANSGRLGVGNVAIVRF